MAYGYDPRLPGGGIGANPPGGRMPGYHPGGIPTGTPGQFHTSPGLHAPLTNPGLHMNNPAQDHRLYDQWADAGRHGASGKNVLPPPPPTNGPPAAPPPHAVTQPGQMPGPTNTMIPGGGGTTHSSMQPTPAPPNSGYAPNPYANVGYMGFGGSNGIQPGQGSNPSNMNLLQAMSPSQGGVSSSMQPAQMPGGQQTQPWPGQHPQYGGSTGTPGGVGMQNPGGMNGWQPGGQQPPWGQGVGTTGPTNGQPGGIPPTASPQIGDQIGRTFGAAQAGGMGGMGGKFGGGIQPGGGSGGPPMSMGPGGANPGGKMGGGGGMQPPISVQPYQNPTG